MRGTCGGVECHCLNFTLPQVSRRWPPLPPRDLCPSWAFGVRSWIWHSSPAAYGIFRVFSARAVTLQPAIYAHAVLCAGPVVAVLYVVMWRREDPLQCGCRTKACWCAGMTVRFSSTVALTRDRSHISAAAGSRTKAGWSCDNGFSRPRT